MIKEIRNQPEIMMFTSRSTVVQEMSDRTACNAKGVGNAARLDKESWNVRDAD